MRCKNVKLFFRGPLDNMRTRSPLIKELQRKIEKTYALDTGITNIEKFVIGDHGYKEFYLEEQIQSVV